MGLNIHREKSKIIRVNASNTTLIIMLEEYALEDVKNYTYLDSIIYKKGGAYADIKIRINKTRAPFHQLIINIKIRIANTIMNLFCFEGPSFGEPL